MTDKPHTILPAFTPVPREKKRHDGWRPDVQRAFIEALAETGSVKSAARRVGRTPESAYQLRRHPQAEEFRKAWQAALDIGIQKIEDIAMERAINGVEEPVYSYGKLVGTRIKYNDGLLMFMLRNRAPQRFTGHRASSLNAADRQMLARLKKEWRQEWEREEGLRRMNEESANIASIEAKIEAMRRQEQESTRMLEDLRQSEGREDADNNTPASPPPGYRVRDRRAESEPKPGPRIRSLRDEGWR